MNVVNQDDASESTISGGVASVLNGISSSNIRGFSVSFVDLSSSSSSSSSKGRRRRELLSYEATSSFTIQASLSDVGFSNADEFNNDISTSMTDSINDGSLTSALNKRCGSCGMDAESYTSTLAQQYPTFLPTLSPTTIAENTGSSGSGSGVGAASIAMISGAVAGGLFIIFGFIYYKKRGKSSFIFKNNDMDISTNRNNYFDNRNSDGQDSEVFESQNISFDDVRLSRSSLALSMIKTPSSPSQPNRLSSVMVSRSSTTSSTSNNPTTTSTTTTSASTSASSFAATRPSLMYRSSSLPRPTVTRGRSNCGVDEEEDGLDDERDSSSARTRLEKLNSVMDKARRASQVPQLSSSSQIQAQGNKEEAGGGGRVGKESQTTLHNTTTMAVSPSNVIVHYDVDQEAVIAKAIKPNELEDMVDRHSSLTTSSTPSSVLSKNGIMNDVSQPQSAPPIRRSPVAPLARFEETNDDDTTSSTSRISVNINTAAVHAAISELHPDAEDVTARHDMMIL